MWVILDYSLSFLQVKFRCDCGKARINAAVKNIDAPMLTRVWQELECRIDVRHVTRGAHIENL
jgi:redox-regulated HSP33 family molecular chaperone